jgi:hypothetical protein
LTPPNGRSQVGRGTPRASVGAGSVSNSWWEDDDSTVG